MYRCTEILIWTDNKENTGTLDETMGIGRDLDSKVEGNRYKGEKNIQFPEVALDSRFTEKLRK